MIELDADGFIAQRRLPDGRLLGVVPLTFGRARLTLGDDFTVEDAW